MNYLEYTFDTLESNLNQEILIALLNEEGYEGFLETGAQLIVYIPENHKNELRLDEILKMISEPSQKVEYSCTLIQEKNWNEQWEIDFKPIEIDSIVKIRASFHDKNADFKYDLIIDPKMSFGTGHHATTRLMIQAMLMNNFQFKRVLDIGCGTGVLGILASKMGADSVLAIDINEWAFHNSIENVRANKCSNVEVLIGTCADVYSKQFDIILANINRNVLLADMVNYFNILDIAGLLILSGIMEQDLDIILQAADKEGFLMNIVLNEDKWHSVILNKP